MWGDAGGVYAVGAEGVILRAQGEGFIEASGGLRRRLRAVVGDASGRYALAAGAVLYAPPDNHRFTLRSPITWREIRAALLAGPLYVAGAGGVISLSRDGGDTWKLLKSGTTAGLNALAPELAIMTAWTVVSFVAALRLFRWQ